MTINFTGEFTQIVVLSPPFSNRERERNSSENNTYSKSEICDSDVPYVSGHNPLAALLLVSGSRYM